MFNFSDEFILLDAPELIQDDNDIQTTIKQKIRFTSLDDRLFCFDLQRQYTILLKSAYARLAEGMNKKDTYAYLSTLKNVNDLDSRIVDTAIQEAKGMLAKEIKAFEKLNKKLKKEKKELLTWTEYEKTHRMVFRRKNLYKRSKGYITKEQFKENKYLPLCNYGETARKGNRKFALDMENKRLIFKLNNDKHIYLKFPPLSTNRFQELCLIQQLMEQKKISVTFKLDKNDIHISYKPITKRIKNLTKDSRCLAIDANPSCLGVSILEFNDNNEFKILDKFTVFLDDIKKLPKVKRDFEFIQISKQIINFMKAYHVGNLMLEDLNMESKDHGKGKALNKCLNSWNRNLMFNNLLKRCKIEGFYVYLVDAKYSTTIGNLMYNYYDPINASLEIGRRGFLYNKLGLHDQFYPHFELKKEWHLRKDASLIYGLEGWVKVHNKIKTLDMKYRVPLEEAVCRRVCIKHLPIGMF